MFEVKDSGSFDTMKRTVSRLLDFDCAEYTESFLKRRFEVRLRKNNIDTYRAYLKFLGGNTDEQTALKKELTIHVTHFFRDKEFWQEFKEKIIPAIITHKQNTGRRDIKIWSAGCSSGEEPLSIAIDFHEKLKEKIKDFRISIIGTDRDCDTIEHAKKQSYDEQQFRETENAIKLRYFTKTDDNKYTPNTSIKSMITYHPGDILKDRMPGNIDIVFCRNTVIYFNPEAKSELYVEFYKILNTPGYFIMGKTEFLNGPARERFSVVSSRERIYSKN